MKRTIIILLILIVVIGTGIAGYLYLTPKTYSVSEDPEVETLEVATDTIIATVNASGRLETIETADANFDITGKVTEVLVEEGDQVQAGDLLAKLDDTDLAQAVELAQIDLTKAQAQLDKLMQPPDQMDIDSAQAALDSARANLESLFTPAPDADIAAAQAALDSAKANLQRVLSGPTDDAVTVAAAALRKTEIVLRQAQDAYNLVAYDSRSASFQGAALEQATIDYETASANYNLAIKEAESADILAAQSQVASAEANLQKLQQGPTEAQVLAAQTQVVQTETTLQKLLEGPAESDLAVSKAAVEATELNLQTARRNLERAHLYSPIAGTVTAVNIKEGDPTGAPVAIRIADLSTFKLNVEIDEIDINRIASQQPVIITLDSLEDEEFEGVVDKIGVAPVIGASGGIVAYPVAILIDSQNAPFKLGMNVTADIETERLENVVVIENRAIQIDRETGKAYVEKVEDDQNIERIEITLGQRSGNVSEIVDGLQAGDVIAIRQSSRREQLRQAIGGPGD